MSRCIVICDDNKEEADQTMHILSEFALEKNEDVQISIFQDERQLVEQCRTKQLRPNMVFMDIELGSHSGIETARMINQYEPQAHIIFLTNYIQYATDVYTTDHQYYILKNELKERLLHLHDKIYRLERQNEEKIKIELKKSGQAIISKKDIIYIERNSRTTYIHTRNGIYETAAKIDDLEHLLGDIQFLRCHNSFLVGMKHIISYRRDQLIVENDIQIPISRYYIQSAKQQFMDWSKQYLF